MKKDEVALITGLGGFIGQNLAGLLIEKGVKVAGIPRELLMNPSELKTFIEDAKPDYIFHLASYGNHSTQQDADDIFATNVIKTYMILKASIDVPYKAFINVSSSSVYGTKDKPMREIDKCEPNTMYAVTKRCGELLASFLAKEMNKPIVTVRPFSVYGEGEASHRFIPTIIRSLEEGTEMSLVSEPVHDWVYIEDFVNGMFLVCEKADELKGEIVNIGTGNQYSNADVVQMLQDITGKTLKVKETKGLRDYDTDSMWVADMKKAKRLGFTPKVSIKEGLRKTYEYYKLPEKDFMEKSLDMMGQGGFRKI